MSAAAAGGAASAIPRAPDMAAGRECELVASELDPRRARGVARPRAETMCRGAPIWVGRALGAAAAREYRLRAVFECGKLDPQVADTPVLAPFPLMLAASAWRELSTLAEELGAEALAAERELVRRADLQRGLGLPRVVRSVLRDCDASCVDSGPRICRLDFHWATEPGTLDGPSWRLSEINADVPGGLIEAGPLAKLMLELGGECKEAVVAPDPAERLAAALASRLQERSQDPLVALVHATAYADDFQVMRRVQECLAGVGVRSVLAAPDHLVRRRGAGGTFHVMSGEHVGGVVRFFPAEWLPELGRPARWESFFGRACDAEPEGDVPVLSNPATAVLVQSKRWSLRWDRLETPLPAWRRALPETRDPRDAISGRWRWRRRGPEIGPPAPDASDWVFKPAMGRVGEGVLVPGVAAKDERAIRRAVRRDPGSWVAQRRFFSVPVESPVGPLHVCLGVYVVDGRAAGLYARASVRALIDQGAYELPVLIDQGARGMNWSSS